MRRDLERAAQRGGPVEHDAWVQELERQGEQATLCGLGLHAFDPEKGPVLHLGSPEHIPGIWKAPCIGCGERLPFHWVNQMYFSGTVLGGVVYNRALSTVEQRQVETHLCELYDLETARERNMRSAYELGSQARPLVELTLGELIDPEALAEIGIT